MKVKLSERLLSHAGWAAAFKRLVCMIRYQKKKCWKILHQKWRITINSETKTNCYTQAMKVKLSERLLSHAWTRRHFKRLVDRFAGRSSTLAQHRLSTSVRAETSPWEDRWKLWWSEWMWTWGLVIMGGLRGLAGGLLLLSGGLGAWGQGEQII